jgi:hypothetical protein
MKALPHWTIIVNKDKVQCVFCNNIVGRYINGNYIQASEISQSCEEKPYVISGTEFTNSPYQE